MDYKKEDSEKAIWNIDDEILKIIKELKVAFLLYMKSFMLEEAYWVLDLICIECDAKLKEKEQKEIEEDLKILEFNRQKFIKMDRNRYGEFYVNLRNLYKKINRLMKAHGVWFREFEENEEET